MLSKTARLPRALLRIHLACMAAACLFTFTACLSTGSHPQLPSLEIPAKWNGASITDGEKTPPSALSLAEWWRQFDDAVLDGLIDEALARNLDLASARAKLREARARRDYALGQLGPELDVSGSYSRKRSSKKGEGQATSGLYQAGFDARWEIDVFGKLRNEHKAAKEDLAASTEILRDTRVSLVAEVALNYVELCAANRRLAIAEAHLATRRETYQLADWREQAGLASQLDVAQARTDFESIGATLPSLRTDVVEAQNRLTLLLGYAPGTFPLVTEPQHQYASPFEIPVAPERIAVGIPAETLRQRPDVRAAERRLAAQVARLGAAKAARYPRFELSGSLGLEALTFAALGDHEAATRSLLGGISAPLFESGRILADIEVQDARLEQAELEYRATILTALEDVENALAAVTNTKERHAKLASATSSAHTTFEIAEQRYATGLTDFLSVLDSQRTLLSLEEQLANSTRDLAHAQIQLYKALGGGWSSETLPLPVVSEETTKEP